MILKVSKFFVLQLVLCVSNDTNNPLQVSFPADASTHKLPIPEGWKAELAWAETRLYNSYSNFCRTRIELETLWSEGRDLINCADHACPINEKAE